jgi:peptidoglycan/xylan/chitin deacetylase (PgdA/CDA1 family)
MWRRAVPTLPASLLVALVSASSGPALADAIVPGADGRVPVSPDDSIAARGPVNNGPRNVKRIALTFDACSTKMNEYDERVMDVLIAARVPATIFIGGGWSIRSGEQVKAMAANPLFELGNHTFSHPHMPRLTEAQMREELSRTQDELLGLTGKEPRFFRPPFGEYDERVVRVAASLGLITVQFDLPSGDPSRKATKASLVSWVLKNARPGSIVVMHINHKRLRTAEALPDIVAGLRARGYELVTVGELLRSQEPVSARVP